MHWSDPDPSNPNSVTFDWLEMSPDDIREEADKADSIAAHMEDQSRRFRGIAEYARIKAARKEEDQRGRDA